MSDFEFNVESELAEIRGVKPKKHDVSSVSSKKGAGDQELETTALDVVVTKGSVTQGIPESSVPVDSPTTPLPEGLKVKQSQQESMGGNGSSNPTDSVNWKQFKTMPGIFERVGGDRPIRLHPHIRKSQVSGIPEPMLTIAQAHLQEKYVGSVIEFPWGSYTITDKNRVFTTKSSLIRYLLFDSFRDAEGTHVQYAKQWLALQQPAFDVTFNPDTNLSPTNDELDIYGLLYVSHVQALESGEYDDVSHQGHRSESDYQTEERLGMLNKNVTHILVKLQEQANAFDAYTARNHMIQTVLLLDRMGLLKGGLPKNVDEFVRVLEQNRDVLTKTGTIVDDHLHAEEKRQETFARQARMRAK